MGPSPLFWILALVLVAATLVLLLVPLLRRAPATRGPGDDEATTAVFRDHKRQLDAESAAGALTRDEYTTALAELTTRFGSELDATAAAPAAAAGAVATAPTRGGFMAALALVALLPVAAGGLYVLLGNPVALAPQATRPGLPDDASVEAMVEGLAARLQANPDDGEGWAVLGRSYRVLGRYQAAAAAYAEAVKRLPPNASLLVDWAEAIAQAQGRSLIGEPTQLLDRALALEPDNAKALALAGAAAMERGERPAAIALWTRLRNVLPPGSSQLAQIDAALAQAGVTLPGSGSAPSGGSASPAGVPASSAAAPRATTPLTTPASPGTPSPIAASQGSVTGRVELDPKLAGNVAATDTVFIFARDPHGSRMPLAALKVPASELPRRFELTDAMAMAPGATLSKAAKVVVEALVSRSGSAKATSGDLAGSSAPVAPGARDVVVKIDRVLP